MVKIVDRHKEETEFLERYNSLYALAKRIFEGRIDGNSSSCGSTGLDQIIINSSKDVRKVGTSVLIFPSFNMVEVYRKSDFEKALEFSQKGEKITNKEITLRTNYY